MPTSKAKPAGASSGWRTFLLGGLLPVVAYTAIEQYYGPFWGLIAGMAFGVFEILYEKIRDKVVSKITWISNLMVLGLGGISLFTQEGFWFKMQPAILEFGMALLLGVSTLTGKNFLTAVMEKQGTLTRMPPAIAEQFKAAMNGMSLRFALFLTVHAALAAWAALYWSTEAWAILKGVGFTVSSIIYFILEGLLLRRCLKH